MREVGHNPRPPSTAPASAGRDVDRDLFRRRLPIVAGLLAAAISFGATKGDDPGAIRASSVKTTFLGAPIAIDTRLAANLRAQTRAHLRAPITLKLGATKRILAREALGAQVDEVRLSALVRALGDPAGPLLGNAARAPDLPLAIPVPLALDAETALAEIAALKDDLDEPPQDAKIDLDRRKVLPEIPGRRIDVYATIAALEAALRVGAATVDVVYESVPAKVVQKDLEGVDLGDTIGWFETKYATDHKHQDRTFNLRLAASRLNGKVILPGEIFDFNAVVGPRDEAHGYRVAKVIADGELVDGIGGGTCQIAGTLHGAAFFAGLEVVQRTPHTRPSSYIKMGLDAAVAYPHVNLKLRNPFPYPVVLKETVSGGVVRAEVLGPKRTRMVTFVRKIDDILPFAERVVRDDRLPEGVKVVTQRGIPGFRVRRYRLVREGTNAVREKTIDVYPATQQIVRVGTGLEAPGARPAADDHPEYVADAYLAITQGGAGEGGMEEVRVPGATGTRGWSRKHATGTVTPVEEPSAEPDDAPKQGEASGKGARKIATRKTVKR